MTTPQPLYRLDPLARWKCWNYATGTVDRNLRGLNPTTVALATNDAAFSVSAWARGKHGEAVAALADGQDPHTAVNFELGEDPGYDVVIGGLRCDVKATHMGGSRLVWPRGKNDLFAGKEFDALICAQVDLDRGTGRLLGWIGKSEFAAEHLVAGFNHPLDRGTWYMDADTLESMELLLTGTPSKPLQHDLHQPPF